MIHPGLRLFERTGGLVVFTYIARQIKKASLLISSCSKATMSPPTQTLPTLLLAVNPDRPVEKGGAK